MQIKTPNPSKTNIFATLRLHICCLCWFRCCWNLLGLLTPYFQWNFVGNCNTEVLSISRSGNAGGWHGVMFCNLFLDVVLHLLGEILVIQEASVFSISIFMHNMSFPTPSELLIISEYEKFEVSTQGEISLLKLTSCPFLASISSGGGDLYCPDSVRICSLSPIDGWGTCINLAGTESWMAPPCIFVVTGVVAGIITSHDAFQLHFVSLIIVMKYPGQDPVFFLPLRKIVRNKDSFLDLRVFGEPGKSLLSADESDQ